MRIESNGVSGSVGLEPVTSDAVASTAPAGTSEVARELASDRAEVAPSGASSVWRSSAAALPTASPLFDLLATVPLQVEPAAPADPLAVVHADPRFAALDPALQRAVETALRLGQGSPDELLVAATFDPPVDSGVRIVGPERDRFLEVLRSAMVLSREFRTDVVGQVGSDGPPIVMRAFDSSPVFVDGSEGDAGVGPWGRHIVDMDDVEAFPSVVGELPYPSATTREQNVVHFVEEAILETRTASFRPSHNIATRAENRFRALMGQPGELQNVGGRHTAMFAYRGAPDERVFLRGDGQIDRIEVRGE